MTSTTHFARVMTSFAVLCIATSVFAQDSPTAGSSGENAEASSKCPVMGPIKDASQQKHGGWGLFEWGLVAESVEPADPSSEFAQEQSDG